MAAKHIWHCEGCHDWLSVLHLCCTCDMSLLLPASGCCCHAHTRSFLCMIASHTYQVSRRYADQHILCYAGITEAQAAASGEGTTPFPAVPTYATINNKCPECSHCDIDYYVGYTQTKNGRYTITWDYIDCGTALSLYNAQVGGSRKLLRSSSLILDGPRTPLA